MFFGKLDNNSTETKNCHKVGQRHESVESIANITYKAELQCGTDNNSNDENYLVNLYALALEEILEAACSVKRPAENSGKSEEAYANSDDKRANLASENSSEV